MGSLLHIPTPFQVLTLTREIENATVSTWNNDPALKASGSLGVVTREIAYPQPGGEARDYGGKADLPALWCMCFYAGRFKWAAQTWGLRYRLVIGAVAEDASTKAALKKCMDVATVGSIAVENQVLAGAETWLASAMPIFVGEEINSGETPPMDGPTPRENKPDRFESEASVPLTVLWSREAFV